ncbi:MAG: DUF1307 domain-containing protein [Bacillota bacterium]|nr:DUF1307 domain-containing protein [Bacillota bacterium]
MKKCIVLLLGLCLIGCSRANYDEKAEQKKAQEVSKEITTVCSKDNTSITFYAKGDQIFKEEEQGATDLSAQLAEETDRDALLSRINDNLQSTYGNIKGVEFQTYWEENILKTIITIDFKKADPQELYNIDFLDTTDKESESLSLQGNLLKFQNEGFACKVVE